MNKRQFKKFTNQGLLKFKTLNKDELCLIQFDMNKIRPDILGQFANIWRERGFNSFNFVPCNFKNVKNKVEVIEFLQRQIDKLKEELINEQ